MIFYNNQSLHSLQEMSCHSPPTPTSPTPCYENSRFPKRIIHVQTYKNKSSHCFCRLHSAYSYTTKDQLKATFKKTGIDPRTGETTPLPAIRQAAVYSHRDGHVSSREWRRCKWKRKDQKYRLAPPLPPVILPCPHCSSKCIGLLSPIRF